MVVIAKYISIKVKIKIDINDKFVVSGIIILYNR